MELVKLALLGIPAVHLGERVIAAQDCVLPASKGEGLEHHGPAGRHGLQLPKQGPVPAHHFGVADEARKADEKVRLDVKVLDGVDVLHLWNVSASFELLGAFVPLIDDRPLGTAGQDQVRFGGDLHVLDIGVPIPRVERLMGVESIAVPLVYGGGAGLRAVGYDEEGFPIDAKRLHVVGFTDFEDVDTLELDELVCRAVAFVDVGSAKQLSHNDEELVIDDQRLTDHR